jgi:hypothetical protein
MQRHHQARQLLLLALLLVRLLLHEVIPKEIIQLISIC